MLPIKSLVFSQNGIIKDYISHLCWKEWNLTNNEYLKKEWNDFKSSRSTKATLYKEFAALSKELFLDRQSKATLKSTFETFEIYYAVRVPLVEGTRVGDLNLPCRQCDTFYHSRIIQSRKFNPLLKDH